MGRLQEQRADTKGRGNEWNGDAYVKDPKDHWTCVDITLAPGSGRDPMLRE